MLHGFFGFSERTRVDWRVSEGSFISGHCEFVIKPIIADDPRAASQTKDSFNVACRRVFKGSNSFLTRHVCWWQASYVSVGFQVIHNTSNVRTVLHCAPYLMTSSMSLNRQKRFKSYGYMSQVITHKSLFIRHHKYFRKWRPLNSVFLLWHGNKHITSPSLILIKRSQTITARCLCNSILLPVCFPVKSCVILL